MQFVLSADDSNGKKRLVERLVTELSAQKSVLWLVPGGSNIPTTVSALQQIRERTSVTKLIIMLSDERFGPLNHPDSNWFQLFQAGFEPAEAITIPVLTAEQPLLDETVNWYENQIGEQLQQADSIILQSGIGPDGHTAGILPHSSAAKAKSELVIGYRTDPFIRITLTRTALQKATAAYVFAYGTSKRQALMTLADKTLPFEEQPAQLFQQLPEAYIFNDQVGPSEGNNEHAS